MLRLSFIQQRDIQANRFYIIHRYKDKIKKGENQKDHPSTPLPDSDKTPCVRQKTTPLSETSFSSACFFSLKKKKRN